MFEERHAAVYSTSILLLENASPCTASCQYRQRTPLIKRGSGCNERPLLKGQLLRLGRSSNALGGRGGIRPIHRRLLIT